MSRVDDLTDAVRVRVVEAYRYTLRLCLAMCHGSPSDQRNHHEKCCVRDAHQLCVKSGIAHDLIIAVALEERELFALTESERLTRESP